MTYGREVPERNWPRAMGVVCSLFLAAWLLAPPRAQAASCAGATAARPCDVFTTILNTNGRAVTAAAVDVPVHPRAVVVGSPTPTGVVRFEWFANARCDGAAVAASRDFALANGVVDAVAFTQTPRKAGGYAFLARYGGDAVHGATVGDCQPLTVARTGPRVIASALTVEGPQGDMVIGGKPIAMVPQLSVTADAPLARISVTQSYDHEFFSPLDPLPAGCTAVLGVPDGAHSAVVCSIARATLGPAPTTLVHAFPLEFEPRRPTGPEGSAFTAFATFEFEGIGQASPFTLQSRVIDVRVWAAPRLSLPPETRGTQGERVLVPILLHASSLLAPAEFRFTLGFDPTLVTVDSVGSGTLAARDEPVWSVIAPGRLRVSAFYSGGAAVEGDAVALAVARLTVLGGAGRGVFELLDVEAVLEGGASAPIAVEGVGGTITVVALPLPIVEPDPPAPEAAEPASFPVVWDERLWTPDHVGTSLGFATLLGVSLTALAEIFNSTVEENRDHFVGWWRRRRHRLMGFLRRDAGGLLPGYRRLSALTFGAAVAGYLLAASVLFAFLEPERALETPGVAILAAGFAIVATTLASQLPRWIYVLRLRRSGALSPLAQGHRLVELHADFWTLAFALVCVAVAYETAVRPGYAYGIVGVMTINRSLSLVPRREQGQLQAWHLDWLSMLCLFGAATAAWLGYSIAHAAHNEVPAYLLERFWILGAETVALGMIPLTFLPGRSLWKWSRVRWGILWALALFLYIQSVTAHAVGAGPLAIGLTLGAYGAITLVFWLYFQTAHNEETCVSCRVVTGSSLVAVDAEA